MPRTWSLGGSSARKGADVMPAPLARDPMDIGKLLEVYDDYPLVVRTLQATTNKLDEAEVTASKALARQEVLERELAAEKQGRERDRQTADQDRELASKTAKAEKESAIKSTDKRVRDELNPRIADLERQLKEMTTSRDGLRRDLDNWKERLGGWATRMESMHKEREAALVRDREAHEKRMALAEKLGSLDEEILASLKLDTERPVVDDNRSIAKA